MRSSSRVEAKAARVPASKDGRRIPVKWTSYFLSSALVLAVANQLRRRCESFQQRRSLPTEGESAYKDEQAARGTFNSLRPADNRGVLSVGQHYDALRMKYEKAACSPLAVRRARPPGARLAERRGKWTGPKVCHSNDEYGASCATAGRFMSDGLPIPGQGTRVVTSGLRDRRNPLLDPDGVG